MPATAKNTPPAVTPDDEPHPSVSRIEDIPKAQRLCRIRHLWPSEVEGIWPGEPLPKGISVVPYADGSGSQVIEECPRCHRKRVFDTMPGNIISADYSFRYRPPTVAEGRWVVVDPDSGITSRDIRRSLYNSVLPAPGGKSRRRS